MATHGTITNDNHAALWHGRFKEGPDADAVKFETSIQDDMRMAFVDIQGSIAHAKMLASQGIIPVEDSEKIIQGLQEIKEDIASGKLEIDMRKSVIFTDLNSSCAVRAVINNEDFAAFRKQGIDADIDINCA